VLAVLAALAKVFRRTGRWIAAGLFALAAVLRVRVFLARSRRGSGGSSVPHSFVGGFHVAGSRSSC